MTAPFRRGDDDGDGDGDGDGEKRFRVVLASHVMSCEEC